MDATPSTPEPSDEQTTETVSLTLFALFDDILNSVIVRRPSVPSSSANSSVVETTDPRLRFGARAALSNVGHPLYRFTRGTCLSFVDAVLHLVAHPEFMPNLPLPNEAIHHLGKGRYRTRFIDYGNADDALLPLEAFTDDDERLDAFDNVFAMAVRFVALHEQAHYYNGHLHLALFANATELPETGRDAMTGAQNDFERRIKDQCGLEWPRASRALELQADAWAVRHLLGFGQRTESHHTARSTDSRGEIRSPLDWIHYSMLGVGCACAIFEVNDRTLTSEPRCRHHPPAVQRVLTAFHELGHQLAQYAPDEGDMVRFMDGLMQDLDVLFDVIGVRPFAPEDFNAAFCGATPEPPAVSGWRACREDVVSLMPALEPFGRLATEELEGKRSGSA